MRRNMDNTELIRIAMSARDTAYAPYSAFCVGAALLCKSGKVYTGCNIESRSFSPTCCAERTAFFKAVSEGEREFSAIAVVGGKRDSTDFGICTPCGVCRQVMSEFCDKNFTVILSDSQFNIKTMTLEDLLPFGFELN